MREWCYDDVYICILFSSPLQCDLVCAFSLTMEDAYDPANVSSNDKETSLEKNFVNHGKH